MNSIFEFGGLHSSFGESATFDPSLKRISMAELLAATRNFSSDGIIGNGSFGLVYKARLTINVIVTVKKLGPDAFQGFNEFRTETKTLANFHHPNIVKILGYCVFDSDWVLIYEFIEKESLDRWLQDTSSQDQKPFSTLRLPLSWAIALNIVRGLVDGERHMEMVDANISREWLSENKVREYFRIAHLHTSELSRERPSITMVVDLSHEESLRFEEGDERGNTNFFVL